MKRKIIKRERVIDDLVEQAWYISQDNLEAAERFLVAAEKSFSRLAELPRLGTSCHLVQESLRGLRRWVVEGFENHLIFYFERETTIEIVRVLYGSRKWELLLDEET